MSGDSVGGGQTGTWLDLGFFPMAFFLFFCTPRVEIDGVVQQMPWGRHFLPLAPGVHTIRIWFVYLGMPQSGLNGIGVNLAAGDISQIRYYMPPWMFARGSIDLVGDTGRLTPHPAAWLADPAIRHQFRYWDGVRWTDSVADEGEQTLDALGGA
jgi:hypothetical protein